MRPTPGSAATTGIPSLPRWAGSPTPESCNRCGEPTAPALAQFVGSEKLPGAQVQSDDELLDYARRNGNTVYHATCTCMMGAQANAVVDPDLRVKGLEGLRVVDASVMPAVTSTNTNAPTIMIAEKGAEMIKAAARRRLAA